MELKFQLVSLLLPLIFALFTFYFYRIYQPRKGGDLLWGMLLILCACLCYGAYGATLDALLSLEFEEPEAIALKTRIVSSISLYEFAVPAVMLAIAANLITAFMKAPK